MLAVASGSRTLRPQCITCSHLFVQQDCVHHEFFAVFLTLDVWLYVSRGMQQLGTYRLSMAPFGTNNSSTYRSRKRSIHVLEAAPCPVVVVTLSCEILGRRLHDQLGRCLAACRWHGQHSTLHSTQYVLFG
jgi:hypothetical protein